MNAVHSGRPVVGVDGSEASPPPWTWPSVKPSPGNAGYGWSPRTARVRRRSPANAQVQRPRWRSAAAVTARLTTSGLRHMAVVSGDRCVGVLSDRHADTATDSPEDAQPAVRERRPAPD
jgi:hypothetical protein